MAKLLVTIDIQMVVGDGSTFFRAHAVEIHAYGQVVSPEVCMHVRVRVFVRTYVRVRVFVRTYVY